MPLASHKWAERLDIRRVAQDVNDLDRFRQGITGALSTFDLVLDDRWVEVPCLVLRIDQCRLSALVDDRVRGRDEREVGTKTSSPRSTPSTRSATWRADVPLEHATA